MSQNIIYESGSILFTTTSFVAATFNTGSNQQSTHPYFANSNPSNYVSMSLGSGATSSVTFLTTSFFSQSVAYSMLYYGDINHTGSFAITVPISESGDYTTAWTNSRWRRVDHEGSQSQMFGQPTASIQMGFDGSGEWRIHKPTESNPVQGVQRGSERNFMYISRSGKLGFKTTSPTDDIDFKANSIKFRSDDGTKEMEFADGKIITKKFSNRSVGSEIEVETSGSELVLTYSPGTFALPTTASVGDVLGTITWEDESIGRIRSREDATAMRIRGIVNGVSEDGTSIKSSMNFGIGSSSPEAPITDYAILVEGSFNVTNSAVIQCDGGNMILGHTRVGTGDADRKIMFYNPTSTQRWAMGVDVSQYRFAINSDPSFTSANDFELDINGNATLRGDLYADKLRATGGYPQFTGSNIAIDGGNF